MWTKEKITAASGETTVVDISGDQMKIRKLLAKEIKEYRDNSFKLLSLAIVEPEMSEKDVSCLSFPIFEEIQTVVMKFNQMIPDSEPDSKKN